MSMLRNRLAILQKQMKLRLEEIRAVHQHSGNKGENLEVILREFLSNYLPPYHRVGHGEIVDTSGSYSGQIDVVVVNEFHPYMNDLRSSSVFFIEGVAIAGEVKSILVSSELDNILENCTRFKALKPKVPVGTLTTASGEDIQRFIERRAYFLFVFESQLTLESVADKITSYYAQNDFPINQQIDGIFLMGRGTIINFGTGTGTYQCITPEGKSLSGFVVERGDSQEEVLLFVFLYWLSSCMPRYSLPSFPIVDYLIPYRIEH